MSSSSYDFTRAISYEVALRVCEHWPRARQWAWLRRLMAACLEDWAAWSAESTMHAVDRQASEIAEAWRRQEEAELLGRAQAAEPSAVIEVVRPGQAGPALLIERPPDGSDAQATLGGEIEIRPLWPVDTTPIRG